MLGLLLGVVILLVFLPVLLWVLIPLLITVALIGLIFGNYDTVATFNNNNVNVEENIIKVNGKKIKIPDNYKGNVKIVDGDIFIDGYKYNKKTNNFEKQKGKINE